MATPISEDFRETFIYLLSLYKRLRMKTKSIIIDNIYYINFIIFIIIFIYHIYYHIYYHW